MHWSMPTGIRVSEWRPPGETRAVLEKIITELDRLEEEARRNRAHRLVYLIELARAEAFDNLNELGEADSP